MPESIKVVTLDENFRLPKTQEELGPLPKVLLCTLTTYERAGWMHPSVAQFLYGLRFNYSYYTTVSFAHDHRPAAAARNRFLRMTSKAGADWLCMIDNDMVVPQNALDTIANAPEDADVVVPTFFIWDTCRPKLCWGFPLDSEAYKGAGFQIEKKYYELATCGTGVIFIRPRIVEKLTEPYFFYTYDKVGSQTSTEDINFCNSVRAAGGKIYGYGGIHVGHYHNVDLSAVAELAYPKKAVDSEEKAKQDLTREQSGVPADALAAEASPA